MWWRRCRGRPLPSVIGQALRACTRHATLAQGLPSVATARERGTPAPPALSVLPVMLMSQRDSSSPPPSCACVHATAGRPVVASLAASHLI